MTETQKYLQLIGEWRKCLAFSLGFGPQHCLRCKTVALIRIERHVGITFFACPNCRRDYALQSGKRLTFRWLHPISLALYPVIFDDSPTERAAAIAAMFLKQNAAEILELYVPEIRLELDDPTQQVRDILNCCASEQELRKYLRMFCEHVEAHLSDRSHHPEKSSGRDPSRDNL